MIARNKLLLYFEVIQHPLPSQYDINFVVTEGVVSFCSCNITRSCNGILSPVCDIDDVCVMSCQFESLLMTSELQVGEPA